MISEVHVDIVCDACGAEEGFVLCPCAKDSYDLRGLAEYLKENGWEIIEDECFCENCTDTDIDEEDKR